MFNFISSSSQPPAQASFRPAPCNGYKALDFLSILLHGTSTSHHAASDSSSVKARRAEGGQMKARKILTCCLLLVPSELCRCLTLILFLVWCFRGICTIHTHSTAKGLSPAVLWGEDVKTSEPHPVYRKYSYILSPTRSGRMGNLMQSFVFTPMSEQQQPQPLIL